MTISDILILTGAGFTRNFGGYLSNEMWATIFSSPLVQERPVLRSLLLEDLNFENVYSRVIESGEFPPEEEPILREAIAQAFKRLDENITRFMPQRPDFFEIRNMTKRLSFLPSDYAGDERALWFTLNQDLFMERNGNWKAAGAPPFEAALQQRPSQHTPIAVQLYSPEISEQKMAEDLQKALRDHAGISYIKLHGSYCWQSWTGKPGMILGMNKTALIEAEPLLKCYFNLFRETIAAGNKKMLVIGYGFRDNHINTILLNGIQKHGLKLYVINPADPEKFQAHLRQVLAGRNFQTIWEAICGYFPYKLRDIFYEDTDTVPWREIRTAIKGA